ncbi:hypothetical protein [Amycolatopsis sp. NPDC051071]|uniref:hypothetical protein n=1 Tax=Amycolatopsis sp. NPDC051071 TaxID=3154637 RepID=UPI003433E70B
MRGTRRALSCLTALAISVTMLAGCREPGTAADTGTGGPSAAVSGSMTRDEACAKAIAEAVWVPDSLSKDKIAEVIHRKITLFQQLSDGTKDKELVPVLTTIAESYLQLQRDRLHEALMVVDLVKAIAGHVEALNAVC